MSKMRNDEKLACVWL